MKSINISGTKREGLGKTAAARLRREGHVPAELYGKKGNVHFTVYSPDLKELIYTPEKYSIALSIDGSSHEAIMKEVQFHPMSDEILHVDFHETAPDEVIKVELPVRFTGNAVGVREGGRLVKKLRRLKVKGMAKDMPDAVEVNIADLGLGKSIKVKDVIAGSLEILNSPSIPLATVEVPRGMKGKTGEEAGK